MTYHDNAILRYMAKMKYIDILFIQYWEYYKVSFDN